MPDLTRLLRPKRYEDVVGQKDLIRWLKTEGLLRPPRPLLISGPSGCGKSTLREIYQQALLCGEPTSSGEACGTCPPCAAFLKNENPDIRHHRSGERSKVDDILLEIRRLSHPPLISARNVFVCEEAGTLSDRAARAFLELAEELPDWASLTFVTNQPDNLPAELRSRCTEFDVKPPSVAEATEFLVAACKRIELPFEREALSLIPAERDCSIRAMLRYLEVLQREGAARELEVRGVLRLDGLSSLELYLQGLSEGHLDRQLNVIEAWDEPAHRKLELIYRAFVDCHLTYDLGQKAGDRALAPITSRVGRSLQKTIELRARETGLESVDFWQALIAAAEPQMHLYPAQLRMRAAKIDDVIRRVKFVSAPSAGSRPRRRRIKRPVLSSASLSWRQFSTTWNAASFLTLEYGVLFNLRVSIAHAGRGSTDHNLGACLVSQLTRQLDMRVSEWEGPLAKRRVFHWIYHHEATADDELVTRLALSVPPELLPEVNLWIQKFFGKRRWLASIHNFQTSYRSQPDVRFHWLSVMGLCRTVDERIRVRTDDGRERNIGDIIGLDERVRARLGRVHCKQVRGNSATLGPKNRRRAESELPVISALRDQAWGHLKSGWERSEFTDRRSELERRKRLREALRSRFPIGDRASEARYAEELREFERQRAVEPMLRTWQGWWLTSRP